MYIKGISRARASCAASVRRCVFRAGLKIAISELPNLSVEWMRARAPINTHDQCARSMRDQHARTSDILTHIKCDIYLYVNIYIHTLNAIVGHSNSTDRVRSKFWENSRTGYASIILFTYYILCTNQWVAHSYMYDLFKIVICFKGKQGPHDQHRIL